MELWSSFIALFLIMDPLGNLPVFISILNKVPEKKRMPLLMRELLIALAIILVFLLAGQYILALIGVEQSSVSIAGGIIMLFIAIRMIFPISSRLVGEEETYSEPFIVPLATPLVAGPSLMAALILLSHHMKADLLEAVVASVGAWLASSAILMCSGFVMKIVGERGLVAMERLMGMILVMISVQMFLDGVALRFMQ